LRNAVPNFACKPSLPKSAGFASAGAASATASVAGDASPPPNIFIKYDPNDAFDVDALTTVASTLVVVIVIVVVVFVVTVERASAIGSTPMALRTLYASPRCE
jgi:hypothetical protein